MSPACAGMIPTNAMLAALMDREPRMRGDDPHSRTACTSTMLVSPACAGMIPRDGCCLILCKGEPRMRGDDPGSREGRVLHVG